MLAPGDFLTSPVPPEPERQPPAPRDEVERPPEPQPAHTEAREPEPESFLLTLLRALGAIHT